MLAIVGASLWLATACQPEIGDACRNNNECNPGQLCDTTVPGGYCLEFDCERNECPDESVCVDFEIMTACLRRCESDSDCRGDDGFVCRDDIGPVKFCYIPPQGDES